MPLAILFGIFAGLGLFLALIGHAAHSSSPAPSRCINNVSPIGYAIFLICGLIALASLAAFSGQKTSGDPYACFGAGRYEAMREGRACPGF
jgi:hypothetical protein